MTISYHGTPLTPRSALLTMAGKHFCVSYAAPGDAAACMAIGQSVMWDNGAFSAFTRGHVPDWDGYYRWLEPKLGHPHWAVIPDVIDGTVEEQEALIAQWPFGTMGAPVWHMGEPLDHLLRLAGQWPRICFGSSGRFWAVGSMLWEMRCDEAFNELERAGVRPWVHMLRGLAMCGKRWPFASADSVNVARNFNSAGRKPREMADEIDAVQCPVRWTMQPEQMEMLA